MKNKFSKFRWLIMLNYLLNRIYVIESGVSEDIMFIRRLSAIENVCHGREKYKEELFYVYIAFFLQLHV